MGHKSGAKHAGAAGKAPGLTNTEVAQELEKAAVADVRALARSHGAEAIKTLSRAMKSTKAPWSVKTKAAKDLIEIGHDRAAVRDPGDRSSTLTVIINQLSTGDKTERVIDGVQTAKEVAEALNSGARAPVEVSDAEYHDPDSPV